MSTTGLITTGVVPGCAPVSRRVRAYFAPVMRVAGEASVPAVFDPALMGGSSLDAMPAPWLDLGQCRGFVRRSGTTVEPLRSGSPPTARWQARTGAAAEVELEFERWGKLQLALSAGVQQMNVLVPAVGATALGSGASGGPAVPLVAGSTASVLQVGAANAATFAVGEMVSVDVDYTGQTGFVGSGASGGYVPTTPLATLALNYVRRVSLNVGLVTGVAGGALTLASPLLAGVPTTAMKVSPMLGFVDREGGGFFQEWSAVFAMQGEQGDRVFWHYPRLQAMTGPAEALDALNGKSGDVTRLRLAATFRALAAVDVRDGEMVLCYRSYLPAAMQSI